MPSRAAALLRALGQKKLREALNAQRESEYRKLTPTQLYDALATFRTKTIRHAHNPCFGQTFVTDLVRQVHSVCKILRLKLVNLLHFAVLCVCPP